MLSPILRQHKSLSDFPNATKHEAKQERSRQFES
jgi:hypothetical protein